MAKTLVQLTQDLERLQHKIEQAKAREVAGVIGRIKEAIEYYGLTPEQLFGKAQKTSSSRRGTSNKGAGRKVGVQAGRDKVKPPRQGKPALVKSTKLPAKFADAAGNSWTGRGSTPRWLAEALAAGKSKDDFAVKT
jgi:DNA-binding protein H-NS